VVSAEAPASNCYQPICQAQKGRGENSGKKPQENFLQRRVGGSPFLGYICKQRFERLRKAKTTSLLTRKS